MRDLNNNIVEKLTILARKRYTGIVTVESTNFKQWIIYFRLGRLVWVDGGYHPNRSWNRHLAKYCPQVDRSEIINSILKEVKNNHYQSLIILFEQNLIEKNQIKSIISSMILEKLFEIIQQKENNKQLYYSLESNHNSRVLSSVLKIAFTLVDVSEVIKQARENWEVWEKKGLANCQPNFTPRIKNRFQLQQEVNENVYRNLVKLIDGNNTLQDLAFQMNTNVLKVAISLVNYIRTGSLELVENEDLRKEEKLYKSPTKRIEKQNNKGLIVNIDDSKVVGSIMKNIIERAGYKLINIEQPLTALPILINIKPDLIFLDLAMPIVNGYEICSHIRRVSKLKNVPIIILTSNKGLIERTKSKIVGATDFLSKPIEQEIILKTINKYLISDRSPRLIEPSLEFRGTTRGGEELALM